MSVDLSITGTKEDVIRFLYEIGQRPSLALPLPGDMHEIEGRPGVYEARVTGHLMSATHDLMARLDG